MTAQERYRRSRNGKYTRKRWRQKNRLKIRKWKREWARSASGKRSARTWYKKSPRALYTLYKKSATRRGLTFALSLSEFVTLVVQPCRFCGALPPADSCRNGLARCDNTQGYTLANVVPCCFPCNQMKGTKTITEFMAHVVRIYKFQRSTYGKVS